MRNAPKIFLLVTIILSNCSKTNVVKLPITTTSPSALEFYNKAMLSFDVGDGPEKRAALDSALALDPNFAMALEMYASQDPRLRKEHQERAK